MSEKREIGKSVRELKQRVIRYVKSQANLWKQVPDLARDVWHDYYKVTGESPTIYKVAYMDNLWELLPDRAYVDLRNGRLVDSRRIPLSTIVILELAANSERLDARNVLANMRNRLK